MKSIWIAGRILRWLSLVVCTGTALLLLSILIYAAMSPIPFLWMRQWVYEDGLLRTTLVDESLDITYQTSWPDRAELLRRAEDEQEYIDQMYRSLDLLRKGSVPEDWGDTVEDYKAMRKQEFPSFYFSLHSPSYVGYAIWEGSTYKGDRKVTFMQTYAACPIWAPVIVLLIYPTVAFLRGPYRRHCRRKMGLCLKCGYNLTGNVSGICPECGETVDAQAGPKG